MPTIQELAEKYPDAAGSFSAQMNMIPESQRRIIQRDIERTGNTSPTLSPGYIVDAPRMPAPTPTVNPQIDMAAMLERLSNQPSPYADQMKDALAARSKAADDFNAAIESASKQKEDSAPSQAELYFRLAAAFGAPTKTGSFFESLGNAGQTAADFQKETRNAEAGSRSKQLQRMLEKQKLALQSADADLSAMRGLASEESKDRRSVQTELFKHYMASGKPQSEAGKFAADQGFKPGTPEFAQAAQKYFDSKMESGDWYKQVMAGVAASGLQLQQKKHADAVESRKKLTPGELKLRTETEDAMASADNAMGSLRKAFKLNPNSFDASLSDTVQRKALELSGSSDQKLLNTRELDNLLGTQALEKLKAAFPGAISNDERKVMMDLQGIGAKSVAERELIMRNAYEALATRKAREKKRLDDIMSGSYRETKPIDSE